MDFNHLPGQAGAQIGVGSFHDTEQPGDVVGDFRAAAKALVIDRREIVFEGLLERANNFPAQLSGGEQQRVSIARALAKRPKLLLCDEPTGALDYNTGRQILKLLQETCRKDKMTVVLITHNGAITPMADHIIRMKSGKIVEDIYNENPKNVEEIEW